MKISCTQENLNQGLVVVSHIAGKNANLPILSNILIKTEEKILTLATTNLEVGITTQVRGKVEVDGEFTIDARLLSDYISLLPKERIDLELDGDGLKVECKRQKTKIKGQTSSEFPLIPQIKKENPCVIKAKDLREAISEVGFAVSTSETRPEISGVYVEFGEKELILAATDSYRLAEKRIKISDSGIKNKNIIIPVKTLQEISRILGIFKDGVSLGGAESVEIYLSENQVMFSYSGVDLVSRLVEGQYPDYTQIIPSTHEIKAVVDNNELTKAVKTASLFTKSGIYDVKLELNAEKKEITVSSSSAQAGENVSGVAAEISGESASIVLNHRYLLDGLQNINSESAVIEIIDANSPFVLRPEKDNGYVYIVMPIKQ